jgi:hypothetical protein
MAPGAQQGLPTAVPGPPGRQAQGLGKTRLKKRNLLTAKKNGNSVKTQKNYFVGCYFHPIPGPLAKSDGFVRFNLILAVLRVFAVKFLYFLLPKIAINIFSLKNNISFDNTKCWGI